MNTYFITTEESNLKLFETMKSKTVKCSCGQSEALFNSSELFVICDGCHSEASFKDRYFAYPNYAKDKQLI
jgi:Zn finger protein HypA/HybF involved in hydrogenase expression